MAGKFDEEKALGFGPGATPLLVGVAERLLVDAVLFGLGSGPPFLGLALGLLIAYYFIIRTQNSIGDRLDSIDQTLSALPPQGPGHSTAAVQISHGHHGNKPVPLQTLPEEQP